MRRLPIGARDAIPPTNARPMGTPCGRGSERKALRDQGRQTGRPAS